MVRVTQYSWSFRTGAGSSVFRIVWSPRTLRTWRINDPPSIILSGWTAGKLAKVWLKLLIETWTVGDSYYCCLRDISYKSTPFLNVICMLEPCVLHSKTVIGLKADSALFVNCIWWLRETRVDIHQIYNPFQIQWLIDLTASTNAFYLICEEYDIMTRLTVGYPTRNNYLTLLGYISLKRVYYD